MPRGIRSHGDTASTFSLNLPFMTVCACQAPVCCRGSLTFGLRLSVRHSARKQIRWGMRAYGALQELTTSTGQHGTSKNRRAALVLPQTASASRALGLEPSAREEASCMPQRAGTPLKSRSGPRDVQAQPESLSRPTSVRWRPVPATTRAREGARGFCAATVQQARPWNSTRAWNVRGMLLPHRSCGGDLGTWCSFPDSLPRGMETRVP